MQHLNIISFIRQVFLNIIKNATHKEAEALIKMITQRRVRFLFLRAIFCHYVRSPYGSIPQSLMMRNSQLSGETRI